MDGGERGRREGYRKKAIMYLIIKRASKFSKYLTVNKLNLHVIIHSRTKRYLN